mmetsp:Transcript_21785/g.61896  ORF Transcript_21785/g.61896 Transcript_21785/m.61896 type:complete len:201 (-) Transcript_21785:157-759(-)
MIVSQGSWRTRGWELPDEGNCLVKSQSSHRTALCRLATRSCQRPENPKCSSRSRVTTWMCEAESTCLACKARCSQGISFSAGITSQDGCKWAMCQPYSSCKLCDRCRRWHSRASARIPRRLSGASASTICPDIAVGSFRSLPTYLYPIPNDCIVPERTSALNHGRFALWSSSRTSRTLLMPKLRRSPQSTSAPKWPHPHV